LPSFITMFTFIMCHNLSKWEVSIPFAIHWYWNLQNGTSGSGQKGPNHFIQWTLICTKRSSKFVCPITEYVSLLHNQQFLRGKRRYLCNALLCQSGGAFLCLKKL
jgi:hypothetical protein